VIRFDVPALFQIGNHAHILSQCEPTQALGWQLCNLLRVFCTTYAVESLSSVYATETSNVFKRGRHHLMHTTEAMLHMRTVGVCGLDSQRYVRQRC
jgi:hypothetical protein